MEIRKLFPESSGIYWLIGIASFFLAIALLATACDRSTDQTTAESLSQVTATRTSTPADMAPIPVRAGEPLSRYIKFDRLTSENGLSNDSVWGMAQDSRGFMWFGTLDGLNRYDGNDFKLYKHNPDDPQSLSDNTIRGSIVDHTGTLWVGTFAQGLNQFDHSAERFFRYQHDPGDPQSLSNDSIRSLLVDRTGALWVGTVEGLNKFDRAAKQFIRYLHEPDNPNSLGGNVIEAMIEDHAGILWVSTGAGLDQIDPATGRFVHYQHDPEDPRSLSHNTVRSIYEDSSGTLWVGTLAGLNRLDQDTGQFTRYQHDPEDPNSLSHNAVYMLYEDQAGILWVGTWGGGLNIFEKDTETFTQYKSNSADPHSLSNNNVWQIYEDQTGIAWIATDGGGVSIIDRGGKPFRHYRPIPGDPSSLGSNAVRAIYEDQAGVLWIGTNSGGMDQLDRESEQFTNYKHDPDDPNSLRSNSVWVIYEDRKRNLWLGGYGSGLIKLDRKTDRFTYYQNNSGNPNSLSNDSIWAIHQDQEGELWIGTNGGGLNRFDLETEQFTSYQHDPADPGTLSHNQVTTIYEDRSGVLWIGTMGGGLDQFDRESEIFTHYKHDPDDPNSLAVNAVFSLHEDRRDRFWIGTMGGGLDRLDRENEQFIHYTTKDGLSSNTVWGILEEDTSPGDEDGNLWLSTTWGLSRFNPQTETFRNYDVSDGLQGNSFLATNSYHRSNSGEMFFGGANGFSAFNPEQIVDNPQIPSVLITGFHMANQPVPIGEDSVLQQSILETDKLVLTHKDNVFSFEFAALNFRAPEKNRYKYKMENFEEEWNEVDSSRRFATYTNLDPGEYVFRVIASNNDGVWNEEGASISITIKPPWWETTWFRIGLGVLVIGLLAAGFRWRVRNFEARSRALEAQVDSLFEFSPLGIALTNPEGEILNANPALLDMLTISEEELSGQGVREFYVEPADRELLLAELHQSGSVQNFGIQLKRNDGESFNASVNMSLLDLEGEVVMLTVVEDVTAQIAAEQQAAALEERDRLAREFHDSISQTLFSAGMIADAAPRLLEKDPAIGKQNLKMLSTMIRGASAEMRGLLLELRPDTLRGQSLSQLLETQIVAFRARSQTEVTITIEGENYLPEDVTMAFHRIAQESLNNVAKYAEASEVVIDLRLEPKSASMRIQDDGRGFDPQIVPGGHLGIHIMRERAQMIGAALQVDSSPGEGTSIAVTWSEAGSGE